MSPLHLCLIFSTLLFALGLGAALWRSNAILMLLGIELMLNAANINFIAFWRYSPQVATAPHAGVVFTIFSIAVAAAEAAVGLALIIAVYRHQKTVRLQDVDVLKG